MVQSTGLAITFVYSHRKRPISATSGIVLVPFLVWRLSNLLRLQECPIRWCPAKKIRGCKLIILEDRRKIPLIDTCYFSSIPMSPKSIIYNSFSFNEMCYYSIYHYLYLCRNYVNFVPNYRI